MSDAARDSALAWLRRGPKELLIGGRWVPSSSGRVFEVTNPATEETLASVAEAGAAEVDAAVAAARKAFEASSWSGVSPHVRTRILIQMMEAVERHAGELAALQTLETGMPLATSAALITRTIDSFTYYSGWPSKILGHTNPTDASGFMYTLREPLGVCGQIIPWNAPSLMTAAKIATALACGNTVVFKPAELAPLTALRMAELFQETDLPAGVVNLVPGAGSIAGAAIANHPGIAKVAFTGSTAVGRQILQASAANFKKVTLELGGKSPNVLFPDADLDRALPAAVKTFCSNSGQVCSAGTRLFVHESLQDEVAERVTRLAAANKVGDPFAPDTKLGPLISRKQMDRVLSYVGSGRSSGARLALGGDRVGSKGFFVAPTVFTGVANTMPIAREEIFGPVLSIIAFKDEADAVFQANDSDYGLSAAVWTRDISRGHQVARALQAGRVWINAYGDSDPVMAFGGYKQSGLGRENGIESIEEYTQSKSVLVRL